MGYYLLKGVWCGGGASEMYVDEREFYRRLFLFLNQLSIYC